MNDEKTVAEKCPLACVQGYAGPQQDDEIDLRELLISLWQERLLLLKSSAALFVIGLFALFLYPKVYEVSTYVERPVVAHIAINEPALSAKISPQRLFSRFFTLLQSEDTWLEYKKTKNNEIDLNLECSKFNGLEVVDGFSKEEEATVLDFLEISYQGADSQDISVELKEYMAFVSHKVIQEIREDFLKHRQQLLQQTQLQIDNLVTNYNLQHDDGLYRLQVANREELEKLQLEIEETQKLALKKHNLAIASLKENLKLAEKIGLKKPTSMTDFTQTRSENGTVISMSNDIPLYMLGVEFLTTKIGILQEKTEQEIYGGSALGLEKQMNVLRKNLAIEAYKERENLAFAEGLSALKSKSVRLSKIDVDWSQIAVFNTLSSVQTEGEKIKPKFVLSLVLLAMLSGFFGLIVVLIRSFLAGK